MIFGDENEDDGVATAAPPRRPAKRILAGSGQQEAFWAELLEGSANLLLSARAGTGKSSSCREGMHRLLAKDPRRRIAYCCFNKKVSLEFAADAPEGVTVDTMHGLGLLALRRGFGQVEVKADKTYFLLDTVPGGAALKGYHRRPVKRLVELAKNDGLRPDADRPDDALFDLLERHDIDCYGKADQVVRYAEEVLARSAEMTAFVDFDDMLWLPVVHGVSFPPTDEVFIDEAQDLNPVQHELALVIAKGARTVIVGDPYQAIYGWRGASTESIADLSVLLDARELPLTVSWRCPTSHGRLARQIVPDFETAPDAIEGTITAGTADLIDRSQPGDLVLCRANAPIVSACLRQIANRRPAVVRGRAIGEQLESVLRKVERNESATIQAFRRNLAVWKNREVGRLSEKEGTEQLIEQVTDQAACLEAVSLACGSPSEIVGAIRSLFADDDSATRVTFSSVHRAKGSEARSVTYLQIPYGEARDRTRPPAPWEVRQRHNLRYVALTRSLEHLTLCA